MRSEVLALVAAAGTDAALLFYALSQFESIFVLFFGIIVAGGAFLRITFLPQYPARGGRGGPGAAPAYPGNPLRLMGVPGPAIPPPSASRIRASFPSLLAAPPS